MTQRIRQRHTGKGRSILNGILAALPVAGLVWLLGFYLPLRHERLKIREFVTQCVLCVQTGNSKDLSNHLTDPATFTEGGEARVSLTRKEFVERATRLFRSLKIEQVEIENQDEDVVVDSLSAKVRLVARFLATSASLRAQAPRRVRVALDLLRSQTEAPWAIGHADIAQVALIGDPESSPPQEKTQ